jgi:DNA-binding Lrp family transcriptional regulator
LTDRQIAIIRFIQGDLPAKERPYAELAKELGITEQQVVDEIQTMIDAGVIRRFGMAVRHQNMGYTANGMSCWNIPDEKIDRAAAVMTARDEITHCYERPRFGDWPYNVYAMIHSKEKETVYAIAEEIAQRIGVSDYKVLFSTIEYKRTSMSYFVEED